MANKKVTYSNTDSAIVAALKNAENGLTLSEISAIAGIEIKPGHIVGAMRKGLIEPIGEKAVEKTVSRPATVYNFVTAEVLKDEKGKDFNYTEGAVEVLKAAATLGSFTLRDLAVAMGKEKMSSGSINHLVKKGNIAKSEEKRMVESVTSTPVNVYGFKSDIPADAEIK